MKRLITCTDGTWNRPGITDRDQLVRSNVELMYNAVVSGKVNDSVEQVKIYDSGVGSSTFDKKDKLLGGISGAGIDKNIKDVYKFLMLNYAPGDEIYLFGFSRGAYTARSLAGLIRNCGLLKPEWISLVDEAYELYRDRNVYSNPDSDLMKSFRKQYCFESVTPIKYIGVWDTVGSLGLPFKIKKNYNHARYKFHDVKISSTVEHAYHALAIDERRSMFVPTLWELTGTVKADKNHKQKMEQRWFPGVHCNVGGGYADCGLSDAALKWLMDKAIEAGLVVDPVKLHMLDPKHEIKPDPLGELRNSRTFIYWFSKPVWRKVLKAGHSNEKIDETVMIRFKKDAGYRPPNIVHLKELQDFQKQKEPGAG